MRVPLSLALLALAGCARTTPGPLPELPAPASASFLPAVREQIDGAYRRAAASPGDPEASGQYGMVLHAYQQYQPARACYERAHELDPGSFRWAYYLAVLQEGTGQRAAALATAREALKIRKDDTPARLLLASLLLASGELEESRARAEAAVADAQGSAVAHYTYGRTLAALRQPAAAAEQLEAACRIAPDYAAAHYALALAYRDLGRTADAQREMAAYQQKHGAEPPVEDPLLLEVERKNAGALGRLRQAERLSSQGRFAEAAAAYEEALTIEKDDKWIHTALISTYSRMGAADKAESHYRAVLALDPAFPKAHFNFALLKAEQSDFPTAVAAFQKALAADPTDAAAHFQLGRVYELMKDNAKATQQFRLALEYDPRTSQPRIRLANRLLADGKAREALDPLLPLLVARDIPPDAAKTLLRRVYPRLGTPQQLAGQLREASQRARASGRTELAEAIDAELRTLEGPRP
jgi:tetratricopeptide (TPR) repeat protein